MTDTPRQESGAERARREAHIEACVLPPGCHWPDYHEARALCSHRHRSIDCAIDAARREENEACARYLEASGKSLAAMPTSYPADSLDHGRRHSAMMAESWVAAIRARVQRHIHKASGVAGADSCVLCGHDLRDAIHERARVAGKESGR